jgi:uncharacterized protein (DUF58 family)
MPHTLKLDARLLAAMDDLSLVAQTIVEGFLEGLHRSPFLGYSTEFSAYRAYTPGDNLRFVDWKLWGRSDEYYVKQFEDDTNVRGYLFLDNSASMDFGSQDQHKFGYARVLAAVLAHLMTRQHDAPGLVLFNNRVNLSLPTRAARDQADEIFRVLDAARASGPTAIDDSLLAMIQQFSRRGLAVVISDFFAPDDSAMELLRHLHAARQEVLVFHVLAPEELDLPYEGEFLMQDSETGGEIALHADAFRVEYQKRVGDFCERVRQTCIQLESDYVRLRTDDPLDVAMIAYLEKRALF